jgi:hypothetical protein
LIGALLAALVALISFIFNYRSTIRNQRDTQFYEALKRFGDKDSPSLRSSAATTIGQMAKLRYFELSRLNLVRPYINTAHQQLSYGLLFEENDDVVLNIWSALNSIHLYSGYSSTPLYNSNIKLQNDLMGILAEFFVTSGVTKDSKVSDNLWAQAEAITGFESSMLKSIAVRVNWSFSEDFEHKIIAFTSMLTENQQEKLAEVRLKMRKITFRLTVCGDLCLDKLAARSTILNRFFKQLPDARGLFLTRTSQNKISLKGYDLTDIIWGTKNLNDVDLSKTNLTNAWLKNADLSNVKLWGAIIDGTTNLENVNWWKANYFNRSKNKIDENLLEILYQRDQKSVPDELTESHPSVKKFLDAKRKLKSKAD